MARTSTSFRPGQSGNPGGRPKLFALEDGRTIADLARENSVEALNTLITIAEDETAPAAARVSAANAILDRGWGKPQVTLGDGDGNPLDWIEVLAARREQARVTR